MYSNDINGTVTSYTNIFGVSWKSFPMLSLNIVVVDFVCCVGNPSITLRSNTDSDSSSWNLLPSVV